MFRKFLYVFCLLAVLLSACASAGPTQAPDQATPVPQEAQPSPYPAGGNNNPAAQPAQPYPGGDTPMAQPPAQGMPYPGTDTGPVNVAPVAGDENMTRGPVFLDKATSMVLVGESMPMQVTLVLRGNVPNPCYQVRAVPGKPNEENRIDVEVYSLAPQGIMCADMLQPFEVQVPLGTFESGKYSVYINGEALSEFGK